MQISKPLIEMQRNHIFAFITSRKHEIKTSLVDLICEVESVPN